MGSLGVKALVVDDQAINRIVLIAVLEGMGYECIEAEDGAQAIELYKLHAPDLVMMDVMMPVMDGYEATTELKKLIGERHVPVIFLTAKSDEESLLRCLECGGDDFLQKPVNTTMLQSKINAHLRTQRLTNELIHKGREIEALHSTLQAEHETGNHVLSHALEKNLRQSKNIRSYLVAQSTFNGDILLSAEKPFGGLYVFLGDITGHGLAAAIGTIPLSQVFFTMTRKGKPPASIIREMNRSLRAFLPRSMFCAAMLIEMDANGTKMRVWSGGLPLCFRIQRSNNKVDMVASRHLPLGVLDNESFNASLETIDVEEGDSLLVMTDGIPESVNSEGVMFGFERVQKLAEEHLGDSFEELLRQYADFAGALPQEDDVSLVEVIAKPSVAEPEALEQSAAIPWNTTVELDARLLKDLKDPVQEVLRLLPERLELAVFQERIATVLTELYSNALEHGVLGLDSKLKRGVEGFAKYYELREQALAELSEARIVITLFFDSLAYPKVLGLKISDSGNGFAHDSHEPSRLDGDDERSYGRGIVLVESLCTEVSYNTKGNEVTALIKLS